MPNKQRAHNFIDRTGQTIADFVVIGFLGIDKSQGARWQCFCLTCGSFFSRTSNRLSTSRCICWRSRLRTRHGDKRERLDGKRYTTEYTTWASMIQRCCNENAPRYKYYGARGIYVCDTWRNSFESFLSDMGRRPGREFSIDRINNDDGYHKSNCRWATRKEQRHNRRDTIRATH